MLQLIILTLFSFAAFLFISDNFKYSNNNFIKLIQKFVIFNSILALIFLIGLILYFLILEYGFLILNILQVFCDSDDEEVGEGENPKGKDQLQVTSNTDDNKKDDSYLSKESKKVLESTLEKGHEIIMEGIKHVAPQLGVTAAAGKAAVEVIKQTSGMAPAPRALAVGTVAAATAAGTMIGIGLFKDRATNTEKTDEINTEGRNSPSNFDKGLINSVLEENEIPLIGMVNGLRFLNYIEFSLIFSIFSLFFRKKIIIKLTNIILNFIKKIKKTKATEKEVESIKEKDKNVSLNKAINTLDKYTDIIIVFIFICFF